MSGIAISILNYRTAELTVSCLDSVLADIGDVGGEVVVVDNASGDGSADRIAAWIAEHPDAPVRLIRSAVNGGFSAGHNQGIAATTAEYVLLLNSDAELRPGCLRSLCAEAGRLSDAGILSARIEDASGAAQVSCFRDHTVISELIRGAALGPVTRLFQRWDVPLGPDPDPERIQWAAFACVLLKRSMIDRIGPLDEGYFLYFEDVEYCRRARTNGWRIGIVPDARAMHHEGGSTGVQDNTATRRPRPGYHYASRSRYFAQAYGRFGLWAANLAWTLGRVLARVRLLFGQPVPPSAKGEARDLWINALSPLATRDPAHGAPSLQPARDP